MTDPNHQPASAELQLLLDVRDEMRKRFHAIDETLRLVINEQRRLGKALGLTQPSQPPGECWAATDDGL